ncbi:MAG: Phosphoserine aminotransferase [Fimbriimonadaceae bacterium]|nr:Phosphoserine aminotransferase [Fimbriimonadaceae bacterium]
MSQPYGRIYNFSAGPCALPVEVLEQVRDDLVNYKGAGMSVMEMSHRGKDFDAIAQQTEADFRKVFGVPDDYQVLLLQGGASLQFSMLPMSFLEEGSTADYVITGAWGKKALEAACMVGAVNKIFDAKETNYDRVPKFADLKVTPGAAYLHFTSNETIQGVAFFEDPSLDVPLVCDMSSDILSRPVDVGKYDMIYAGAQKNMGPAGLAVVVMSPRFVDRLPAQTHPMLDYRLMIENKSMYNTPNCWSIYVCGLVYQWVMKQGGLAGMNRQCKEKAQVLYDAIDGSGGFYKAHAQPESRSIMNITWTLANDELTDEFLKGAKANGMAELKGHRSVGGVRASIYNAFPIEGCRALAEYMRAFAAKNG